MRFGKLVVFAAAIAGLVGYFVLARRRCEYRYVETDRFRNDPWFAEAYLRRVQAVNLWLH